MKCSFNKLLKIFVLVVTLLVSQPSFGRRMVLSATTPKPIAYASVGILDRQMGTVTDSSGYFTLQTSGLNPNDILKISCIGYEPKCYSIADFANMPDSIFLTEKQIPLQEIVVKPQKIKNRTVGRKNGGGFICIEIEGDRAAGQGVATPLKVKKRAWLKELGFSVINNSHTLSSMKFRVNIYRKDGDRYELDNIPPVYFDYSRKDLDNKGRFLFSFPCEIMLEKGEYYVELEFLHDFRNEFFVMKTKPMTGKTRYRYASQSGWKTLPFGAPIYINYDNVE